MSSRKSHVDVDDIEVIAPHFKRRLSGVTSTVIQLVPAQRTAGLRIAVLGPGLPAHLPHMRLRDVWRLWKRPQTGGRRVWHARRNVEMLAGLVLRDALRMPLALVFTSASQRHHTRWTRFLIARMDAVVATSEKTAAYLQRSASVILHGVDTGRFRPADDKSRAKAELALDPSQKHIGCFGRIRRQKGTDLFIDAIIECLPGHEGWSAIVAGRATGEHASFQRELEARVAAAGLRDRILFVGEHNDIERWYRALDVFVAPQRWEGFGLTPLEAMASGVPVVATDVGAFSELILEGETGAIVAPDDRQAMIQAIEPFLLDADRREAASASARAHAKSRFSLDGEAQALIALYRKLSGDIAKSSR